MIPNPFERPGFGRGSRPRGSTGGADPTIVAATVVAASTRLRALLDRDRGANDRIPTDPLGVRPSRLRR